MLRPTLQKKGAQINGKKKSDLMNIHLQQNSLTDLETLESSKAQPDLQHDQSVNHILSKQRSYK